MRIFLWRLTPKYITRYSLFKKYYMKYAEIHVKIFFDTTTYEFLQE